MTLKLMKYIYFRLPVIVKLFLVALLTMTLFGTIIHFVEPSQFPTIFDGIWWAFVTGATVGYGDYVPLSIPGRIIAIFLILTGGGIIAYYISSIAATTVQYEQDLVHGKIDFKGKGHLIVIGWNERTKELINIFVQKFPDLQIVLIDRSEEQILYGQYPVHFIRGDATEDGTLIKANIMEAAKVLISADLTKSEKQADSFTILTILTIRGNHHELPIVAEVLSSSSIENAKRAGANTIIRSNDFISTILFHELSHQVSATPFEDIIQILKRKQFSHVPISKQLEYKTFLEASTDLQKKGYLPIGIIRHNDYKIHPPTDYLLQEGDIILTLVDWQHS